MEEWAVLRRDILPAYITWDQYQANQERMHQNRSSFVTRGAPRQGSALLGGLAACARCGWRMFVMYRGRPEVPRYVCNRYNPPRPDQPRCPSVSARTIDTVVSQQVLAALAPSALELSLNAAKSIYDEHQQVEGHWRLQLERARYQTQRARRQYDATEPENRLVARELERHWEESLRAEQHLEEEYARFRQGSLGELSVADRVRISALAADVPGLWASAGPADRQAIIRYLVERVEIDATERSEDTRITIRWVGGCASRHELVRPVWTYEQLGRFPQLLTRLRELLAEGLRSSLIAARLNEEGFRSPRGDQQFTADRIRQIVCRFGLRARRSRSASDAVQLGRHEVWMTNLAEELTIPIPTLTAWCRRGWVSAHKRNAPEPQWVVWADDEEKSRMRRLAGGRSSGLRYPYPKELTTPKQPPAKKRRGK